VFANGDRYDGEWAHGLRHGRGRYTWSSGDEYTVRGMITRVYRPRPIDRRRQLPSWCPAVCAGRHVPAGGWVCVASLSAAWVPMQC
jgi:hypothetical protein